MSTLSRKTGEIIMSEEKVQLGPQNCDTCALTQAVCGKLKKVKMGYCRWPFVPKFSFNKNDLTQSIEIKSLVGDSLNHKQQTRGEKSE
jgi:hypothetical protein